MANCTVDDCPTAARAKGLCVKHYSRLRRYGSTDAVAFIRGDEEARFWSHVDRRSDTECWPWTAYTDRKGYGIFKKADGKNSPAHRWAYEHFVGPIPDGLTVDHVKAKGCVRKDCVNYLAHLEPVTNEVNILRSHGLCPVDAHEEGCGHVY
jgi:hypothetical protein